MDIKYYPFLGYLESSMGIGLIAGPVLGSALYTFFGFEYTFLGIGGVFIVLAPLLIFLIPNSVNIRDKFTNSYLSKRSFISHSSLIVKRLEEISHSVWDNNYVSDCDDKGVPLYVEGNKASKRESVKYYKVFFRPVFFIISIATFLSYFWCCYTEPTMAIRLNEFNLSSLWIGAFFSISSLMYTVSSLLVSCFSNKINNKLLIVLGLLFNGLGQLLVGPSPFLPDSLVLMWVGQVIHGFTVTFFLITCLPAMINDAVEGYPKQKNEVTDMSSGIFNSMLGIGQMLGPIYGSNITNVFNFRIWADSVGVVNVIYGIVFLIVWKSWSSRVSRPLNIEKVIKSESIPEIKKRVVKESQITTYDNAQTLLKLV